ncbi:MAG: SpoIIE family protein phosphatase [Methylophagaceae bacterium]
MSEEVSTAQVDVVKLPNLAPRIITVVLIVCLVLLVGQWMQDRLEKQENLVFQKISLHYQQLDFIGQINNAIMVLLVNDSGVETAVAQELLRTSMNQLKRIRGELRVLEQRKQDVEGSDEFSGKAALIAQKVEQIIMYANDALAEVEANNEGGQRLGEIFEILLLSSQHDKDEISHYIAKLTAHLSETNESNQRIGWLATLLTLLLVFFVSLSIYWRGKKLVHKQFNLINKTNKKLKDEVSLRKDIEEKITQQAEENLAEGVKLKSILNSTNDAIITITPEAIIDSFNKAAEKMFGYPASYAIGQNVKILIPESRYQEHENTIKKHHETGELEMLGRGQEALARRVDGSEFPVYSLLTEVEGTNQELYLNIIQDITIRKKSDEELKNALADLTQKQTASEEEERIARHVFENITASNNDIIPEVSSWCEPMGTFSGDMMLSAELPSGGIRVILCDFTGHGLPAALGAVPVSTIHSAMAKKGLPLEILMNELNNKLNELLPTGIFCCIAGIDIDASRTKAQIWNAGLPEVLVVNQTGEITQRIVSNHLPLGVVAYNKNELHCREIQLGAGDTIYALSDGLTEAESEAGDMFGQQRFEQLLMNETDEHGRLTEIRSSIGKFVGKAAATDDVSLIEIKTLVTTE